MTLLVRALGLEVRLKSEDQVQLEIERDAREMFAKGYRIASTERFEIAPFGAAWYRVTYQPAGAAGHAEASTGSEGPSPS